MNLNWIYDGSGEWTAITNIMDPDMVDEPRDTWCPEWCLAWHIAVNEDGLFCISDSDIRLMENIANSERHFFKTIDQAQSAIDLHNDYAHGLDEFADGQPVVLREKDAVKA